MTSPGVVALKPQLTLYIAASFKHIHGVRLLGKEFSRIGCEILDWTMKAVPPQGLTSAERRIWMDTDRNGGQVYAFCRNACLNADLVVYFGASGQDAGVEIGMASAVGAPILGIRGPLESPGLMLHGAVTAWVEDAESAILAVEGLVGLTRGGGPKILTPATQLLSEAMRKRRKQTGLSS